MIMGAREIFRQERGFTLLELLVAIAISALVLMVVYQTFNGIVDSAARLEEVADLDHMARVSLGIISRELRSAYWKPAGANLNSTLIFSGTDGLAGGAASDELVFTTFTPLVGLTGTVSPNLSVISYELEAAAEEEEFYLMHSEDTNSLGQSLSQEQRYELAEHVKGLNLRYYDGEDDEWMDEWDAGLENKLPNAVEIELYFKTSSGEDQKYATSVEIPMSFK